MKKISLVGIYSHVDELIEAIKKAKNKNPDKLVVYTPSPIHEVQNILENKRSRVRKGNKHVDDQARQDPQLPGRPALPRRRVRRPVGRRRAGRPEGTDPVGERVLARAQACQEDTELRSRARQSATSSVSMNT